MPVKLLACAALLAACTHRRPLYEAFARVEPGRWVTIQMASGATLSAITVHTATGIGYQGEDGNMIEPVAIVRITDVRRLRGAGTGLLIGTGVGAVTGVVLGFADGDDPPCENSTPYSCLFEMTAGQKAVVGGLVVGTLGSLVGLAAGAMIGSDDIYESPSGITITPGGPSGSIGGATVSF